MGRRGTKDQKRVRRGHRVANVEGTAEHADAIAMQRSDVPTRAPKGRKSVRVRKAGRTGLVLPRPKVLWREAVNIRANVVVVGKLVARPQGPMEGPTNKLESAVGRKRRCPDRNGEPIGDLMTELGQEREMRPGRKESVCEDSRG